MRTLTHRPPQVEAKTEAKAPARVQRRPRVERGPLQAKARAVDPGYGETITLFRTAVQAKAAADARYGDLIAAARELAPRGPGTTGRPAPARASSAGRTVQAKFSDARSRAGTDDNALDPEGGGYELKRKYYYATMFAPFRKLTKPKPNVWNPKPSEAQGNFVFDIIEPIGDIGDVDWSRTDPAREADRRTRRDVKVKKVHETLTDWRTKYAEYQKLDRFTEDQVAQSLKTYGEDIAEGLQYQLGYVEEGKSAEGGAGTERAAQLERAARIDQLLARMGVVESNQRFFVVAKYGDKIVAIGSAYGGYIDHVVAHPDSQIPKEHRPKGTVSGGGRAVTHKMIRLMVKRGLRPTVSPQSPRATEGIQRYFTKRAPRA